MKSSSESEIKKCSLCMINKWITILGLTVFINKEDYNGHKISIMRVIVSCCYIFTFQSSFLFLIFNTQVFTELKIDEILISDIFNTVFESIFFITTQFKAFMRGKEFINMYNNFMLVDKALIKFGISLEHEKVKHMLKLELFILPFTYLIFIMSNYAAYNKLYFFEFVFLMTILVYNRLTQLFQVNACILLRNYFNIINNELNKFSTTYYKIYDSTQMGNQSTDFQFHTKKISLKKKLKILIAARNKLLDMTNSFNCFLGKRNLLFIAFNTVVLTFHIYIIVVTLIDPNIHWIIVYYSTTWIIFRVINIILVVLSCTYTAEEVCSHNIYMYLLLLWLGNYKKC